MIDGNKFRKDIFQTFIDIVEYDMDKDIQINYEKQSEDKIQYTVSTENATLGFFLVCFSSLQEKYDAGEISKGEFIRRLKNSGDERMKGRRRKTNSFI